MKSLKRIRVLALMAALLCVGMLLCACQEQAPEQTTGASGEAVYRVTVADALGNRYGGGVVVLFMQNGEQIAIQPVNEEGVAEKTLERGDYTVSLAFTSSEETGYFDDTDLTLSAEKTELTVTVAHMPSGEPYSLYAQSKEHTVYHVGEGCTYATLTAGERNYFLFAPTVAGTYEFSTLEDTVQIGYYGAPHFVQETSAAEVVDNTFTISVSSGMIGTVEGGTANLVIGIDAGSSESCVLTIQRIGDPKYTIADEPWTPYVTTHTPEPFVLELEAGQRLTYVNIMGSEKDYNVVYSESDGYYHLGDETGPIIYINLGKEAPNVSLQTVIGGDGAFGGAPIRKYFYDENGEFVKKEDYTEILMRYFECIDGNYGVYPLNKDLVYIIENGCSDWWDESSPSYLFFGCNPKLGWLFACCYITQ